MVVAARTLGNCAAHARRTVPDMTATGDDRTKILLDESRMVTQWYNVIADLSGWYPANADYTPVTPTRILDTRN